MTPPVAVYKVTLKVRKNETYRARLSFVDRANNPVNFTGASAKMQIRATKSITGTLITELSTENNLLDFGDDNAAGDINIEIPLETALAFTFENPAYFDIAVTFSNGDVKVVTEGEVILSEGVTTLE